jgi:uncharacterized protein (TIGR03382 family)
MRSRVVVVSGVVAVGLLSTSALARSTGITGVSGQSGTTCTRCHAEGATKPTVEFVGPTSVTAGSVNRYTFVVRGGPAVRGGLDVTVSDAMALLDVVDGSLKKSGNELVHTAAKTFDATSSEIRFDFALTAPATAGGFTLYGAGNSTNGDGKTTGDGVQATTLAVTVTGSGSGTDAGTDAGTGGAPDAGPVADAGTDAGSGGGQPDAGPVADAGTGTGGGQTDAGSTPGGGQEDDGGGCSSTGGAPMLVFVLGLASMLRLSRRRA